MGRRSARVRSVRAGVPEEFSGERPSFVCAYATDVAPGDARSAEEWARDIWEGAPAPLRLLMTLGWRGVLRLRLGPRDSPEHILGWSISERAPERTVCHAGSSFLSAYNTFVLADDTLVWSTAVFFDRPMARLVWPPVSLLHRPMVRWSLARARRLGTSERGEQR